MLSLFSHFFKKQEKSKQDYNYLKGYESYKIGRNLVEKKNDEEALTFFDIAIGNGVKAYQDRGDCLNSLGFLRDAIEDYTRAIEENPTDCNLYFCRGVARHSIGDLADAISDKWLAIQYSQLENEANTNKAKIAKTFMSSSVTEFYELAMVDWEDDLESDIKLKDKISKLIESGLEKNIELANHLMKNRTQLCYKNLKRRHPI